MHTVLIFKEQAKVMETGLREKGLAQPHYSIQVILVRNICMNKYSIPLYNVNVL
jgi:hypothetical protein